jgi:hypothetical protein
MQKLSVLLPRWTVALLHIFKGRICLAALVGRGFKKKPLAEWLWLVGVLACGSFIRWWGLDFGLPHLSRPDEQNLSRIFVYFFLPSLLEGQPDWNPHFFEYPSLYIYMLYPLYLAYYGLGLVMGWFSNLPGFLHLYLDNYTPFHLISRGLTATMGCVTLWAIYRAGASFAQALGWQAPQTRWAGLLSLSLLSGMFLHVRDSHFGVTDVPATLWVTLALWQTFHAMATGKTRPLWRAAALAGLAAGTKYPAGLVLLPTLLAAWQVRQREWGGKSPFNQQLKLAGGLVLLSFGVFLLSSPYVVLDSKAFWADFQYQREHIRTGHLLDVGWGWWVHPMFSLWHGTNPWLLAATLASAVWGLLEPRRWPWLALLSFALAFFCVIGPTKTVFVRYAIPLLPVLCLASALGGLMLQKKLMRPPFSLPVNSLATVALWTVLLSAPMWAKSFRAAWLLAQDDTRNLAAQWIMRHLKPGHAVGIGFPLNYLELPHAVPKLFVGPAENEASKLALRGREFYPMAEVMFSKEKTPRNQFKISSYGLPQALNDLGCQYVVVGQSPLVLFNLPDFETRPLFSSYRLVYHVSPVPAGQAGPGPNDYDQLDAFYLPYTHLEGVQRPGPELWVFEVPQVKPVQHAMLEDMKLPPVSQWAGLNAEGLRHMGFTTR